MTRSSPVPVLFTHYGDEWIRGSETLLLDLLINLDPRRVRPIVWCNSAAMAEAAISAGFATYRNDFEYYFNYDSPHFNINRYRSLVRKGISLVRKHDIRVLHANSAAPSQWLVPVSRSARIPLLTHLHIDYRRRSRYALLLHQAALVVGCSQQVIDDLVRDGMPPNRTRVIYNGVDFARLRPRSDVNPRRALGIPDDAIVVSTIGSLIPRKGHDVLISAFASLYPTHNVHLLIGSDGPERENLERLKVELNLRDRLHFLGYYEDLPSIYRCTDIFALASRGDAFGLVVVEAGYFGLPVVSTTVGGIPEVVAHGLTGLLVPPDDAQAFAAALSQLVDDGAYRRRLGVAAKERVERLFSHDRMVTSFHETYEELDQIQSDSLGWFNNMSTFKPYLRLLAPYAKRQ